MKKAWKRLVLRLVEPLAAVVLLGAGACSGKTGVEEGFEYSVGGLSTELTRVTRQAMEQMEGGRLAVPAKLGGKRVRYVAPGAFQQCTDMVSVKIPWRVSRIGKEAFAGCTNLLWAELPSCLVREEDGLFRGCSRMEVSEVPERVEEIGTYAYAGCRRLKRVALPAKLRSVGAYAFSECSSLESVELPDGLSGIGEGAFEGCGSWRSLRIPAGVTNIGDGAFAGCTRLKSLDVAEDNPVFCSRDGVLFRNGETQPAFRLFSFDPFYGLYAGKELNAVAFEGTVLAASTLPDPAENDYDHCLYALSVEVHSVLSSSPPGTGVDQIVLVNVPIMKDRTLIGRNAFEEGDRISCTCAEYDAMPQAIREIQLADDILSFELRPYYAMAIRKIQDFQTTERQDFTKREITILPIQSLPRDTNAATARRARIQGEIARIESELEEHGGSFEAWKEEYRAVAEEYGRLCAAMYKGWIKDSYFAAGETETSYETKEFIEGILPYKKHLEDNNIDLVILRVPTKWDFAARVLAASGFRENPAWMEHYYECLKNDIEIVDPMPEMWKERFAFPLFYFYNVHDEFHPYEGMCFVGAKVLAEVLERYPHQKTEREIVVTNAVFESWQARFFWPAGNEKFDSKKNVSFRQVFQDGETIGGLLENSGSPFLFLSNSYFWFPQRPLGASLPGYTAYFLQTLPDWVHQDGAHHNSLLRHLVSNPSLLNGRRVVAMVGDPDGWKGFPPLPKYIRDQARRISLEKTLPASSGEITVHDGGAFLHTVKENGAVTFIQEEEHKEDSFELEFDIPRMEGMRTCMIRLNFGKTWPVTIELLEVGSDVVLDTCFLPLGRGLAADFFVPVADGAHAKILFKPRYPRQECTIENIELWYY